MRTKHNITCRFDSRPTQSAGGILGGSHLMLPASMSRVMTTLLLLSYDRRLRMISEALELLMEDVRVSHNE